MSLNFPFLPLTIVYCISFANSFVLDLAALLFCFFGGCDVEALDFILHEGSTGDRFSTLSFKRAEVRGGMMQEEQRHCFSYFYRDCRASALGQARETRLEEETVWLDLPTTYLPIKKIKFQTLNVPTFQPRFGPR